MKKEPKIEKKTETKKKITDKKKTQSKEVNKKTNTKKKKSKAFTLIELLAVIIILGILMIIAIPSVTTYIQNSRKSAYINTAREIISGTRTFVNQGKVPMYDTNVTYYVNYKCINTENASKSPYGEFVDGETFVVVTYNGSGFNYYWVSRDETGQGIKTLTLLNDLDEDDIETNIASGEIKTNVPVGNRTKTQIINAECQKEEEKDADTTSAVAESGNSGSTTPSPINYGGKERKDLVVGDLVKIGDEEFYVINNDKVNDKITLLSHYNLKVGNIYNSSYSKTGEYTSSDTGYGLQSSDVRGKVNGVSNFNGTLQFTMSYNYYWKDKVGEGNEYKYKGKYCLNEYDTGCVYVYDLNSSLFQYVESYKEYLEGRGAIIKSARLMTLEEAYNLKTSGHTSELYYTAFWLGSANGPERIWYVGNYINNSSYSYGFEYGVRPVIVI